MDLDPYSKGYLNLHPVNKCTSIWSSNFCSIRSVSTNIGEESEVSNQQNTQIVSGYFSSLESFRYNIIAPFEEKLMLQQLDLWVNVASPTEVDPFIKTANKVCLGEHDFEVIWFAF